MDLNENGFLFSLQAAEMTARELERKKEVLGSRIDRIVREIRLADQPVISFLLGLSHDEQELDRVGRGIQRIATLISEFDDIKMQIEMVNLAKRDPLKMKLLFGDLNAEVEADLQSFDDLR